MEIENVEAFLPYLESVRRRTRAVAECIPEDRLEWSPGRGRFTPGDLVRHIAAAERWMWAENVQGASIPICGSRAQAGGTKEEVLELLDRLHAGSADIIARLTPEHLQSSNIPPRINPERQQDRPDDHDAFHEDAEPGDLGLQFGTSR